MEVQPNQFAPGSKAAVLGLGLLLLGMLTALFFYGVGYNLLFLFVTALAVVAALGILGPQQLMARAISFPFAAMLAFYTLAALIILQLVFSVAPDTSASPSWVLACVPLWFLAVLALPNPRPLFFGAITICLVIALIAMVRFLVWGQRAYDPLADASNLGSLLYLAWIPAVHWLLVQNWYDCGGSRAKSLNLSVLAVSTFVALLVIFATASRAAQLLCFAVMAGWFVLGLVRRQSLVPVIVIAISAAAAYGCFLLRAPGLSDAMTAASDFGGSGEQRWLLIDATWHAIQANGFWGSGIYTFSLLYPMYRSVGDQSSAGLYAHNDYLQLGLEGGLWLVIPIVLLAGAVAWRSLAGLAPSVPVARLKTLGGYWALGALLAHACVNFIFYTLSLAIAAGLVAGFAMSHRFGATSDAGPEAAPEVDSRHKFGWLFGLLFGLVALAYFALDVASYSVLSGQPGFGFTDSYRTSSARQLAFAQTAERLNERRGLPVLAQAMLSEGLQRKNPESKFRAEQTLALYRRAIEMDELNPSGYVSFAKHLINTRTATTENPAQLLQQALRVDPKNLSAILTLVDFYDAIGKQDLSFAALRKFAYPWLDYYSLRKPAVITKLVQDLKVRGAKYGDAAFLAELEKAQARIANRDSTPLNPVWFITWRAQNATAE